MGVDMSVVYNVCQSVSADAYSLIRDDVLFFSIAIAAIVGKMQESSKRSVLAAWVFYFIGTLMHELSHFVMSFLTYGKPFWFSVIPSSSIDKNGKKLITLGHVKSSNVKWWNVFFISLSPLLLLPFSYYVYENFFNYFDESLWSIILYVFLIVSLLSSSVPSDTDLKNVFNSNAPANLIIPVMLLVFYMSIVKENSNFFGGLF